MKGKLKSTSLHTTRVLLAQYEDPVSGHSSLVAFATSHTEPQGHIPEVYQLYAT